MHPDSQSFFRALGKRLRELRKEKGWSVRDMVLEHGYHDAQWRHYENGKAVTIDSLLRICGIFQLSFTELIANCECGQLPKSQDVKTPSRSPARKRATATKPLGPSL